MRLKQIWILYWLLYFFIYLPFTREPDVFKSKRVKGIVEEIEVHHFSAANKTQTHENPFLKFYVDSNEYWFAPPISTNYLGLYQKGDSVTLIYEEGNPKNVKIAAVIGYWINYSELAIALLIISIITIIHSAIKNWKKVTYDGPEELE